MVPLLTSALDGGERSASRSGHFKLRNRGQVHFEQETGWASEPVWTFRVADESHAPGGSSPERSHKQTTLFDLYQKGNRKLF